MIAVGNESEKIKNKDRWNYFHRMPMLPLLVPNNRLPLLHMSNCFIFIEETGERINEFDIGYMINPSLHVNKAFRDQVEKFINNTFGALTQPFVKTILSKKTSVLELLMFHETRGVNPNKVFRVLSCAIYTIIENYVCIGYLACQSKTLSEISVGYKYVEKYFNRILGIGILDFLIKLLSCHGFSRNIKYFVILKFP